MKVDRLTVRRSPKMRRQSKAADEEQALTAFDRVQKSGLIGIVHGAPRDLSTNPKYFDSFATK